MKNYSYTIVLFLVFLSPMSFSSLAAQQIVINEFAASNATVIEDEADEADDWIELYNASETTVDLSGMFLSDNANNLVKWQIPEGVSIPPHGFLLFWCDDQEDQGSMHTSFKLSSGGEDLLLIHSDGTTVIDSYSFGPQTTDASTGRESDGSGDWVVFPAPSPNESNGSLGNALAKQPVASQIPGHYNNAFTLTLSTDLQDAIIRYTTDGSVPNEDDEIYNTSLTIDSTTVLRSRTFHADFIPSRTTTNTYLFGVEHDFAIFCISSDTANIFGLENGIYPNWSDDIEHEVHVEFFEPDGTFGFGQNLGIQVFGGYSQTYDHKSLSLTARSEYGANKINYPLFPDQEYSEYGALVLRNSGSDWKKTMFRDAVASGLLRDIDDVDAMIKDPDMEFQAFRPAIVYMNGQYFGIHNMREKMDWRYLETHYGIDKDEVDVVQRKNKLDQGNLDAWDDYSDFIEDADFNNAEDMETLKTWIDPDHFADYFLAEIYLDNTDWPGNNNRRWRERKPGKQWRYFLYDLDRVMGLIPLVDDYNSGNWSSPSLEYVTQDSSTYSWNQEWSTLLLRKLLQVESFKIKFINRMADQLNIIFDEDRMNSRITAYENRYAPEIQAHADRWWNNNNWTDDVDKLYIFADGRTEFMWNHFDEFFDVIDGVAEIKLNAQPTDGGTVHMNTMKFSEGNFPWFGQYFEGVDVPLKAEPKPGYLFTGWTPATIDNNALTSINLSGNLEVTANFQLGSTEIGNVVINEINYHSPDDADAGDWVELYNADETAIDVSGWYLDNGDDYFNLPANTIIPPYGYLVLVEDSVKFQSVHPTITNFIGSFGKNSLTGNFKLSNSGEWFAIKNADSSFRDTVRYDDKLPWPESPDGDGPTLQLLNASFDNALPQSWTASLTSYGTPGTAAQGSLELGEDLFYCEAETVSLDAGFSPCFNCSYEWSNGETSPQILISTEIGNNTFTVTVTDSEGNSQTDEIDIFISEPIEVMTELTSPVSGNDGSIMITPVGGTSPFSMLWASGNTEFILDQIPGGIYSYTITDANGCTLEGSVELGFPNNVSHLSASAIKVFPNPNDGHFFITGEIDLHNLSITDVTGRNVTKKVSLSKLGEDKWFVDMNDLTKGVYFLRFSVGAAEVVERVGVF